MHAYCGVARRTGGHDGRCSVNWRATPSYSTDEPDFGVFLRRCRRRKFSSVMSGSCAGPNDNQTKGLLNLQILTLRLRVWPPFTTPSPQHVPSPVALADPAQPAFVPTHGQEPGYEHTRLGHVRYDEVNSATNGIFAIWAGRFDRPARLGLERSHSD